MYQVASPALSQLEILPGVTVEFHPITRAAVRAARKAAQLVLADDPEAKEAAGDAYSAQLIGLGLAGWSGIAGPDGKALPFSADNVQVFLADVGLFEAADTAYVLPYVLREAEKNGLSASPAGTSAGRTRARPTARTVTKPAKTAPTTSTRPARRKATPPGA